MRYLIALTLLFVAAIHQAGAQEASAPSAYRPPVSAEEAKALHPGLPQATIDAYLNAVTQVHQYQGYLGKNEQMKALSYPETPLKVGAWFDVNLAGASLFEPPITDGAYQVYLTALDSLDARALSLYVDLRGLAPEDQVWVLDPVSGVGRGPYYAADQTEEGLWLPTLQGDTTVLAVRTLSEGVPPLAILGAMHYYFGLDEAKTLGCEVDIACEPDASIRALAAAVGLLYIKSPGNYASLCTGTLINNNLTAEYEPYLLTAAHCINTSQDVVNTEVVWDYQLASCDATVEPNYNTLPRSYGQYLLATNKSLDTTLMQLGTVPSGSYGRLYVGWSTLAPVVGDAIFGIHHPEGDLTKISHGAVQAVDSSVAVQDGASVSYYQHETRVGWTEGLTEGGSSGSALFTTNHELIGTLSAGNPDAACGAGPSINYDYYSSFRSFYPSIVAYIASSTPPTGRSTVGCSAVAGGAASLKSMASDVSLLLFTVLLLAGWRHLRRA